jgi:hypothetical protein
MAAAALATAASLGAVTVWALTIGDGSTRVVAGPTSTVIMSMSGAPAVGPTLTVTVTSPASSAGGCLTCAKSRSGGHKSGGAKGAGGSGSSASSMPKGPLAGPGCPATEANKTDTYSPSDGWHPASGGWSGNGCDGTAEYTQTTGSPTHWEDVFNWVFTVRKGARCQFMIYIPDTSRAGTVAPYDVYGVQTATQYRIATFSIDQPTHRGKWVSSGSYTFPDGVAQMALVDRGAPNATVAASATIISCS